jgi:hypothetical protein
MNRPLHPAAPCPERETSLRLAALRSRDALDAAGESILARHVANCPACLADAMAVDPALLFVRLAASAEAGEGDARGALRSGRGAHDDALEAETLAADVLAAIRVRAVEGGAHAHGGQRGLRPWLKTAAVVLLASGLAAVLYFRRPDASVETSPAAGAVAVARPIVERLENPGARVYQFAAATPSGPTVVFIANPGADL